MELSSMFIVGFIVLGIYKLVELNARKDERKMLIQILGEAIKKSEAAPSFDFPDISFGGKNLGSWALRISLLMMGIGLGLLVDLFLRTVINFEAASGHSHELRLLTDSACIAFFGGLGLFVAFLVERNKKD
ncbi:MAG: hypothetical protein LBJ17_03465 [Dysgonamonadaceae bacterium]|jgi:hypothetical protein|nr:hypothetical protein [Dysgonamonadaceae bacterium]